VGPPFRPRVHQRGQFRAAGCCCASRNCSIYFNLLRQLRRTPFGRSSENGARTKLGRSHLAEGLATRCSTPPRLPPWPRVRSRLTVRVRYKVTWAVPQDPSLSRARTAFPSPVCVRSPSVWHSRPPRRRPRAYPRRGPSASCPDPLGKTLSRRRRPREQPPVLPWGRQYSQSLCLRRPPPRHP
jgi:hypothetical protein